MIFRGNFGINRIPVVYFMSFFSQAINYILRVFYSASSARAAKPTVQKIRRFVCGRLCVFYCC